MKTHTKKQPKIKIHNPDLHYFEIFFQVHGKNKHTEIFSMPKNQVQQALNLGYLNGFYLDWKPLNNNVKDIQGGIYKVNKIKYQNQYIIAYTENNGIFSLPKYLEKDLKSKEYILFGKREKQ